MSDYDDYENNLAFDPNANSGLHRSYTDRTQSTIKLIEKIEELTKWRDLKSEYISKIEEQNKQLSKENEKLKDLLEYCLGELGKYIGEEK